MEKNISDSQKLKTIVRTFQKASIQLEKALAQPKNEYIRDSAIQRFEFTFELFWKMLKEYVAYKGLEVRSPRDSIRESFSIGLLEDDTIYLEMMKSRNLSSHTYHEETAEEIYESLFDYLKSMRAVSQNIEKEIE